MELNLHPNNLNRQDSLVFSSGKPLINAHTQQKKPPHKATSPFQGQKIQTLLLPRLLLLAHPTVQSLLSFCFHYLALFLLCFFIFSFLSLLQRCSPCLQLTLNNSSQPATSPFILASNNYCLIPLFSYILQPLLQETYSSCPPLRWRQKAQLKHGNKLPLNIVISQKSIIFNNNAMAISNH